MTDTEKLVAELREAFQHQRYPEIMTPLQASSFLGVSEAFLRDHRKMKSGPPYSQPMDKIVRYMRQDLIDWIAKSRRSS